MDVILKFIVTICTLSGMLFGGVYTYKYLNNKLTSSNSIFGIFVYAMALFIALAGIYAGGLFMMAKIYHYIAQ